MTTYVFDAVNNEVIDEQLDYQKRTFNDPAISTVATGTAPFVIASTTVNANLNADMVDGYHVGTSGSYIPALNGTNTWSNTQNFAGITTSSTSLVSNLNADMVDGYHVGTSGSTIPRLDTANTWSNNQTISASSASPLLSITNSGSGVGLSVDDVIIGSSATTGSLLRIGDLLSSATVSSPPVISMGGVIGNNTPGYNGNQKLRLFEYFGNFYGFGVTPALLEIQAGENGGIGFFVNSRASSTTEAMRILVDGKVGIGTTSPDNLLHVNATAVGSGAHIGSAFTGNYINNSAHAVWTHSSLNNVNDNALVQTSTGQTILNAKSGQYLNLRVDNTDVIRVSGSAVDISGVLNSHVNNFNYPISSFTANSYIEFCQHINLTAGKVRIGVYSSGVGYDVLNDAYCQAGGIFFQTSTTDAAPITNMVISPTGKVGISTSSPDKLLHVNTTTTTDGAHIGTAFVGNWYGGATAAIFGHYTYIGNASDNYGLLQNSTGATYLNSVSGNGLYLRIGNANVLDFNSSGHATFAGNLTVSGTASITTITNGLEIKYAGNGALEIGRKDGTYGTPYIDFHTGANLDHDARILVTGSELNTSIDQGILQFYAAEHKFNTGAVRASLGIYPGTTTEPIYSWNVDFGTDAAGTWRKIAQIDLPNTTYAGTVYRLDISNPKTNYGWSDATDKMETYTYFVACTRSKASQNDTDSCTVTGPGTLVRAVKLSQGSYEIQISNTDLGNEYFLTMCSVATSNSAIPTYFAGNVAGSAGIATYTATVGNGIDYFRNLTVAGTAKVNDFLVLPKTSGKGIKVDTTTPTFGWHDLIGEITPKASGSGAPSRTLYRGNIYDFAFINNDVCDLTYHIPHDYVPGSDMYIHVHWSHNGTAISGNVVFTFYYTYSKGHNQATFPADKNITITYNTTNIATTPQYQHRIDEAVFTSAGGSATLLDNSLIEVDGLILAMIKVTTLPTITGGSLFIHTVDVHYQSTGIPTKAKAPNFYT